MNAPLWHPKHNECHRRATRRPSTGYQLPSTTAARVTANLNIGKNGKNVKGNKTKILSQTFRKTAGTAKVVQETRREEGCEHFEPLPFWT